MHAPGVSSAANSAPAAPTVRGAWLALALLLGMNLFNYVDRQILAAVEPEIQQKFFPSADPHDMKGNTEMGYLASAFLVSYMLAAPLFGAMATRFSRWLLVAVGVSLWSIATGAGGLAATFAMLFITRCFVGVGEGAYGPLAPAILSDYFPASRRGWILSLFYVAIPVGGALGYALGGQIAKFDPAHESWRWAFYVVVVPGLLLGLLSLMMREPRVGGADGIAAPSHRPTIREYKSLLRIPSYVFDTLGMTAMTFAIGAYAWWMPRFLETQGVGPINGIEPRTFFGAVTALAGLTGTLAGGFVGDRLRPRLPGAYFLVSGIGLLISVPAALAFLFIPFPTAWIFIFIAEFFLFFNTGPSNTILANVVYPSLRPAGFAMNIFAIHLLGDVISPPLIGAVAEWSGSWRVAFSVVAASIAVGGVAWLCGAKHLARDTAAAVGGGD